MIRMILMLPMNSNKSNDSDEFNKSNSDDSYKTNDSNEMIPMNSDATGIEWPGARGRPRSRE